MSGREFKFGQTVRLKDRKDTRLGVVIARTLDNKAILAFDGIRGEWTYPDDALEPSAQPHVAAGRGWRERTKKAIENARDLSYVLGCVEERNESTSEIADAKADDVDFQVTIDALLAEVVELPADPDVGLVRYSETWSRWELGTAFLKTRHGLLCMAAALIRAAREQITNGGKQ